MDGTVTTQPVLEHVGMSTWPGIYQRSTFLDAGFSVNIEFSRQMKSPIGQRSLASRLVVPHLKV